MLRCSRLLSHPTNLLVAGRAFSSVPKAFTSNRNVLIPNFPLKTKPGKTVSIEVAEFSDRSLLEEFCCETFLLDEPILRYLEVDRDTFVNELLDEMLTICLRLPYSMLALDDGQVIGYYLGFIEFMGEGTDHPPRGIKDFGLLYDHYVTTHHVKDKNAALCATLVNYALAMIGHFVPKKERLLMGHQEHSAVRREYRGNEILMAMMIEAAKQMKADNLVEMLYGTTTGKASAALMRSMGYTQVWEMPYKQFKIYGENVFGDGILHDGNDRIRLFLGSLDDIVNKNELK